MRFSAVAISSLIAVASARGLVARQDDSTASTDASPSATASLTPQASCLADCDSGDVNCQAGCVGVAHPNSADTGATTDCAASCDQGDGSPSATEKYSNCVQSCISSYFPTTGTAAPAAGGAATGAATNSAAATGAEATGASASGSSGSGASATGSGSSSSSTGSSSDSDSDSSSSGSSGASSTASGSGSSASSTGAASVNNVATGAGLGALFMALLAM